jgi:hypothetical protein
VVIKNVKAREVKVGQNLQLSHARGSERIISVITCDLGYKVEIQTLHGHLTYNAEAEVAIEE